MKRYEVVLTVEMHDAILGFNAKNAHLENEKTLIIDGVKISSENGDSFKELFCVNER
jgi:hypothetical protein